MKFIDTFSYHKDNPDITLDDYVRSKRIRLGVEVENKDKIYLDTKYWIHFRDVILGRTENDTLVEAYMLLDSLCDQNVIKELLFVQLAKTYSTKLRNNKIRLL